MTKGCILGWEYQAGGPRAVTTKLNAASVCASVQVDRRQRSVLPTQQLAPRACRQSCRTVVSHVLRFAVTRAFAFYSGIISFRWKIYFSKTGTTGRARPRGAGGVSHPPAVPAKRPALREGDSFSSLGAGYFKVCEAMGGYCGSDPVSKVCRDLVCGGREALHTPPGGGTMTSKLISFHTFRGIVSLPVFF